MKTVILAAAAMLAAGSIALAAGDKPPALPSIPYQMADDIWQCVNGVDKSKLEVHLGFSSTNRALHPADIYLTIQTATKGAITVPLDTNGEVIDFPHTEALRRENPTVTVNQPAGSLNFTVWCHMPLPEDLTFPYRRLADGVAETRGVIEKTADKIARPRYIGWGNYAGWLFSPNLKVPGVIFEFPNSNGRRATLEIRTVTGTKTFRADAGGKIKLKLDKSLLSENPEVKISEKPRGLYPDVRF